MKTNNKILLTVLGALVLIFFATNYFRKNNSKTTLKTDMVLIDTAKVSNIEIDKALGKKEKMLFQREGEDWRVSSNGISSKVKPAMIKNLLGQLDQFKIERLVAKDKDKWGDYQLTDSTATKVSISENTQKTELYLGRIQFNQPTNPYQQRGFSGSTYIRINDDENVYTTKGMLSSTFGRDFNSWRNGDIIKTDKNAITKIEFKLPEEQFVITKKDSIWSIGSFTADSTKVAQYLSRVSYKSHTKFADSFSPTGNPVYEIQISGNDMADVTVQSYRDTLQGKFYIKSSYNPEVFFESDSTGIFKDLFVGSTYFKASEE